MEHDLGRCPGCGSRAVIIYVNRRGELGFPALGLCECESCQQEWRVLLTAQQLIGLADSSSIPVDWSPDWPLLAPAWPN